MFTSEKRQFLMKHWRQGLFQMLIAWFASLLALSLLDLRHDVIIASIGATAFIMFAKPGAVTAQPRHVIVGQIIGVAAGVSWALVPHHGYVFEVLIYSASILTCLFLMVITDTNHPPAAGTALGITLTGFYPIVLLVLMGAITLLILIHYLLKKRMIDLL